MGKALLLRAQVISASDEIIETICAVIVGLDGLLLSVAVGYRYRGPNHDGAKLIGDLTAQRFDALSEDSERAEQKKGCKLCNNTDDANSHLSLLVLSRSRKADYPIAPLAQH